ncbi:MAG: DUF6732 family protein [Pseudomonadota bacterium]
MKYVLILMALVVGTMAAAHPGHLHEAAGHTHWFAAGALAAAAVIALTVLVALVRKRRGDVSARLEQSKSKDSPSQEI